MPLIMSLKWRRGKGRLGQVKNSGKRWLQKMLLQIQRYDLHVKYTPRKDMLIADALSKAFAMIET